MMQVPFTKILRCVLAPDERNAAGNRLAQIAIEVEMKKEEIKRQTADLKLEVKNLDAEAKKTGRSLLNGFAEREVRCEERLDMASKRVETWRLDSDTLVESRPATEEELQGNLFMLPRVPSSESEEPVQESVKRAEAALADDPVDTATGTDTPRARKPKKAREE